MNFPATIFEFVTQEESAYQTREVHIFDNYQWSMAKHIQTSVSFKHGKFLTQTNDISTKKPFKNIVLRILEFRYAAEDRDVKDIIFETEEPEKQHLSFLVKKYWDDVFTIANDLDSFLDDAIEEKVDFGGVLVKKAAGTVPEVIPLQSIAFCDQTDMMAGPIGLKFDFTPDSLRAQAKSGWGDSKNGANITIDELIAAAKREKETAGTLQMPANQTPGKNIEVYVVRGIMPESYLREGGNQEVLVNQVQVVTFYTDKEGRHGNILFRGKETEEVYKFHTPKKIFKRALGLGGVEVLFDDQIWTNSAEIHKHEMLEAGSKVIPWTDDAAFAARNKIHDMENMEWAVVGKGSQIGQVPNASPNIQLFNQALNEWALHAQEISGVSDPLVGKQPPAGTPFRLQERVVFEGKKPHERIAGKFDKFIEEIITDWVLPHMAREITKGKEFLATLSSEEMQYVLERVPRNRAVRRQREQVLNGENVSDLNSLIQIEQLNLLQNGNKQILKALKDEFKGVRFKVKVRVASKQKDMSLFVDKLVNVMRQYFATPQMRQDPVALRMLNKILEASGLSPIDISEVIPALPQVGVPEQATRPIREIAKREAVIA